MTDTRTETHCASVEDFLGYLSGKNSEGCVSYYRGHGSKAFKLEPYIYRKSSWVCNEHKVIREVLLRCPEDFKGMVSSFEKLVKMQHYGIPTRLLDVTENPLVSLYFACRTEPASDGEVLLFNVPKTEIKYFDSDAVSVVSNVAWVPFDFEVCKSYSRSVKDFHKESNSHAAKLMHEIRREKPHFLNLINPDDIQSVICVKPQLNNPRISRQEGAFFLYGISGNKSIPASINPKWLIFPKNDRCIVKSVDKKKILDQLATLGLSEAKLFPEIDHVAEFIKNDLLLDESEFKTKEQKPVVGVPVRFF